MRKLLVALAVMASSLIFVPSASAHGTCHVTTVIAPSGSTVFYGATYACDVSHPNNRVDFVFYMRHSKQDPWQNVDQQTNFGGGTSVSASGFQTPFPSACPNFPGIWYYKIDASGQAFGAQLGWHNFKSTSSKTSCQTV